jgi:hypothetical protein
MNYRINTVSYRVSLGAKDFIVDTHWDLDMECWVTHIVLQYPAGDRESKDITLNVSSMRGLPPKWDDEELIGAYVQLGA